MFRALLYAPTRLLITGACLLASTVSMTSLVAQEAAAPHQPDEAQRFADQGRALLQAARKAPALDPQLLTQARTAFLAAQKEFVARNHSDDAAEAAAHIAWCDRQLDLPEMKAALAAVPAAAETLPPTVFMHRAAPSAQAVPLRDEAACKAAVNQLRIVYAKDYAKRTVDERRQFAEKLYQAALKNRKDPIALQAILMESIRIAAESGELVQVQLSVDRLTGSFTGCDGLALKKEWIEKAAVRGFSTVFVALLDHPQNPVAQLIAGRYTAVELDRFDEALPMLVRGTPGPLTQLAQQDLAAPEDTTPA